jgi:O-antigen/teichoic acid export membrane protein
MTANALSTISALAAAGISTPYVLDRLGTAAFGVWTVLGAFVIYLGIAESGIGPAVQRYVAVAYGAARLREAAALMWTMLAAYVVAGALLCLVLRWLAGPIVGLFDFPRALSADAVELLKVLAVAVPVTLLAAGVGNVLFGLERFVVAAVSSAVGALVLLAVIVGELESGAGLPGLGRAVLAQQAVVVVLRLVALRDLFAAGAPALASRGQVREVALFAAKLQLSALSVLINGQSDKVVAGLVAPAATVGRLGVASQLAESGRIVAGALLGPISSRLSVLAGQGDRAHLLDAYRRLSRTWIVAMTGATAVGLGLLYPLLRAWLGAGYGEAVLFGAILVLAYGINVITGVGSAYVRAVGAVGIEARSGLLMVGLNVLFTIPLGIRAGALGVVLGTLGANVLGTAWFFWRVQRLTTLPVPPPRDVARVLGLATVAGGLTLGGGWAAVAVLPRFASVVPVVLVAGVAFALFAALALRTSLRGLLSLGDEGAASARTEARTAPA